MLRPGARSEGGTAGAEAAVRVWPFVLVVWAIVAARLCLWYGDAFTTGYGDTDDATRLVMVRDLMHGQGWYDLALHRFQSSGGVILHWSRLVDGAIAALDGVSTRLLGPERGEELARWLWPLLLVGPALFAGLRLTASLAGRELARPALWAASAVCVASLPLFVQFHPGRIDHHNVQIVCWLVALAGAVETGVVAAALAGIASAVGLAIGLEALVLHAAIGAVLVARGVIAPGSGPRVRGYGAGLALAAVAAFLVQTPPSRWGLSVCDAMGMNLTLALVVAGGALWLTAGRGSTRVRVLGATATAVAAAIAYLVPDPACIHGPFAEMNPALKGMWLDHVQEVATLAQTVHTDWPTAFTIIAGLVLGPAAWALAGRDVQRRQGAAWALTGVSLAVAAVSACAMLRMSPYLFWAATPPVAVAAAMLASWLAQGGRVDRLRAALFGLLLAPCVAGAAQASVVKVVRPRLLGASSLGKARLISDDACSQTRAFASLAQLPAGRVLAAPDLGPFLVANTSHTAIAAPYHRMDRSMLASHAALSATGDEAQGRVRALGADYVVVCPGEDVGSPYATGLRAQLARGVAPAWLIPASAPGATLAVWRVRIENSPERRRAAPALRTVAEPQ